MWSVHVRFSFSTIPKKLKDLTRLMGIPFIFSVILSSRLMSFILCEISLVWFLEYLEIAY